MTDDEKARFLLEILVAAMLVSAHRRDDNDMSSPGLGILGGPPPAGEEDKHDHSDAGFGSIFALNKMTDLVMRCLEGATRYRMATELNALYVGEDEDSADDMRFVQMMPVGVTFNLKFKKDMDQSKFKKIELAADLMRSYAHYRLFEKNPTVSEFIEQVEWRHGIEEDDDLTREQKDEYIAFFEDAVAEVVTVLHIHHDSIKEHSSRIFDKCLAHLRELLAPVTRSNTKLDVLFGIKPLSVADILKMSNIG